MTAPKKTLIEDKHNQGIKMEDTRFNSGFGFLMAATGFAVGLGNIWRFPFITGENGGGAFVLVYLACVIAIGIPTVLAELIIGRRGRNTPPVAIGKLARAEGKSSHWLHLGNLNLVTAFAVGTTYCIVTGWVFWYLYKALVTGFDGVDSDMAHATFTAVTTDLGGMMFWTLVSLVITSIIVYFGVNAGIERTVRVLMPTLLGMIIAFVIYNSFQPGFAEAFVYLFSPDFSTINGKVFLVAVGHAFFSIGVAMAGMMVFGSYLPKSVSIIKCGLLVVLIDTLTALFAGLMLFPMVFRFGLDPTEGAGLIFQTLPVAFALIPGGQLIAIAFFFLLTLAALTSMVGFMEPLVARLEDHYQMGRHQATLAVLGGISLTAGLCVLSYDLLASWTIASLNINDLFEFLANQIMLPLGGLLIAIFAGWQVSKASLRDELGIGASRIFNAWYVLIRYLVPPAIAIILIGGLA